MLSTLGLTDDDITSLRAQDKVEDAEGEYVIDAFASSDSLDAVVKVLSLTGRSINEVLLRGGRMPERADECVVEENMLSLMNIAIGDRITLTPGDDLSDALAQDTYTVVGTVRSPVYLAVERGTSTLGSGTVKAYLYLPREAFTLDYYTAAYVRVSGAAEMTAFYSDYDDYIDAVIDELEPFGDARSQLRHDDLVDEATEKLDDAQRELDDAKAEADEKLGDAQKELSDARRKLDDGWKDYYDGEEQYADGVKELSDAYTELTDGEKDYRKGLREYADGKAEADEKIADAQEKITDARRKVADIDSCEWYIFSRSYNPGYTGFGQDADRMANLASVLPIIFFLVAALVCLTTMTRMVEEQRVQIGALKALGYSRLLISRKYIGYGLLPSLVGGVLGLVIGYILFPKMIFTAYQIMYQMPDIELHAYTDISLFSVLAAVACTTVATLWACLATLRETPASLMRPRTPKAGKRVFLEYIKPLWKRMSFIHKVTARNLFRYQKRLSLIHI